MAEEQRRNRFENVLDPETGRLLLRYDRRRDTIQLKPKWADRPRLIDMKRLRDGDRAKD